MTIYLCTDAKTDLHNAGELNTEASRLSFARAWELTAKRICRAAGVDVVADGDVSDPTIADFAQRNRASGANLEAIDDVWQMIHDSVRKGARNGRWIAGSKASTDKTGAWLKAALKRPARDDE